MSAVHACGNGVKQAIAASTKAVTSALFGLHLINDHLQLPAAGVSVRSSRLPEDASSQLSIPTITQPWGVDSFLEGFCLRIVTGG
eukprot:6284230-Amphidinium_carterae.1